MHTKKLFFILFFALISCFACSEVPQTEEDCTSGQFFDFENDLCIDCPAITIPACPLSCGYTTTKDARGCDLNECSCEACEDGSFFDRDVFACVACQESPACGEGCTSAGEVFDEFGCSQNVCECPTECPVFEAPECGAQGCCSVVSSTREDGCEVPTCSCPETPPEGFYFDASSVCQECEGADPVPEACTSTEN